MVFLEILRLVQKVFVSEHYIRERFQETHCCMKKPLYCINMKAYPQTTGAAGIKLALALERTAKQHRADVRIAMQATDLAVGAHALSVPVIGQHCDGAPGQRTGAISALALSRSGARGSLLNHSERRITDTQIIAAAAELRKHKLTIIVCAESTAAIKRLRKKLQPDYFAIEPPELIGGNISVSTAKPALIKDAVTAAAGVPVLAGAGIKTKEDVLAALALGAAGVLVASGVVLAKRPADALRGLLLAK
jgi:triosephosphate isomerase